MNPRALVQPEALLAELGGPEPPLVVDVRWSLAGADRAGYLAGHLPGAVFCDLDADLAAPPGDGGRHPLPSVDRLATMMRRLGIGPSRDVVVLDGGAGGAAARAWWCLRWVGHERVRVLDGGLAAWVAVGGPLESGEVTPVPAHDVVVRPGSMRTVEAADVLAGTAGTLLDARAPERFRGDVEPIDPVAGHIPGAVDVPTAALQGADGRYLAPDEARAVLLAGVAGAAGGARVAPALAAYCGSGVTAAQLVLVGHDVGVDVALYPGSWSHWIQDPGHPIATGD
ncbi:MAG: sulfurtransferase [Actinomycetales bacterium]|nr:sulfurtransferase [Actinomycetales bacterium]